MGALLLFKALAIICAFQDYVDVKKTGTSHGWDVAFDNFRFFKGILLFTVIVLIGNGWFMLKPYIQERDFGEYSLCCFGGNRSHNKGLVYTDPIYLFD